ncbi:general odorant-binding protein 68 [Anastrepha obliqua]|uniref:general odorant-binding protein 68 n=1 Tax=Anastrepha obliqua TaxID=95512 RepID=UPI00240988F6|nr:general odorant-binding protein 68 [Anastrepha obliqua]
MKATVIFFVVICVFGRYASADDASVDCTKHPRHVPPHMCCPVPDLSTDELMKQCDQYAGPPPIPPRGAPPRQPHPHPHGPHPNPCLIECIFNKTEVMEESGELNQDKFKELLATAVKDNEEMAAIMEESFQTCIEKATEMKTKVADKISKDPEFAEKVANHRLHSPCSPFSAMLMGCIKMETFQNCPTSAWNDTEECNTMRSFMKQCKRDRPTE